MATRIVVKGIVQGVSYRFYTRKKAEELGLEGYVRNLRDGSVEIVADGKKVEELVKWCWEGSPLSKVTSVEVEDIGRIETNGLSGFEIRY